MRSACWMLIFISIFSTRSSAQNNNDDILWAAAWSPDGKYIAVGGNPGSLKIYTKKRMRLKEKFPWKRTIAAIRWHPTEEKLVIATHESAAEVSILDLNTKSITTLDSVGFSGARGIDWNFDGQYLAVADNEGQITIYTKEGEFIRKIKKEDTKSFTGLAWHPSKNILVTVSAMIRMYNLEGDLLHKIKHRPKDVLMLCVAWHPSGDFFATGDYGIPDQGLKPLLQFWNSDGSLRKVMEGSKAEYRSIRWTRDGKKLATASDALRIWSKDGKLLREGKSENLLWGLDWRPDKKRIITSDGNGIIALWNAKAKLKKKMRF